MASRGVWFLKKLTIRYCPNGGSSSELRNFIASDLIKFAQNNPQLSIEVVEKSNRHPLLVGEYISGIKRQISLKNYRQQDILDQIQALRNTDGHKVTKLKMEKMTQTESIQGMYYEGMKSDDIQLTRVTKF
ncbi:hypothetical protein WA158_003565 [Blastocystis sp. Blastoise]